MMESYHAASKVFSSPQQSDDAKNTLTAYSIQKQARDQHPGTSVQSRHEMKTGDSSEEGINQLSHYKSSSIQIWAQSGKNAHIIKYDWTKQLLSKDEK